MDSVVLLPTNVPGPMFQENVRLEDHSVKELKKLLEYRSLEQTGSKDELIQRINDCIDNGGINKIFLGIDQGKCYDMKRNILQIPSSNKGTFDVFEENFMWSRFPSRHLPQYFNKGHIFTYMVNGNIKNENPEVVEGDNDSRVTVKPFRRSSQYVDSDHLSHDEMKQIINKTKNFHENVLVPEMFAMKVVRVLSVWFKPLIFFFFKHII